MITRGCARLSTFGFGVSSLGSCCPRAIKRSRRSPLVALEVFEKGHAIGLGEVRAPEMATIPVAGPHGIDAAVLLPARHADRKADPYRVILALAERKRFGPLLWRKQQVV